MQSASRGIDPASMCKAALNIAKSKDHNINHRMMMERYPNLKEEVRSSIPDYEISSPPNDKNLADGQQPPCFGVGLSVFRLKRKGKRNHNRLDLGTLCPKKIPGTLASPNTLLHCKASNLERRLYTT